jgi:phosphohistidine phosphatase SixA
MSVRGVMGLLLAGVLVVALAPSARSDAALWRELRQEDGLVILYRHALAPGVSDPPGFQVGDCSTQRNLSAEGRTQAREMGAVLRAQRVPVVEVRSSRWCRALDTARLMGVGAVRPSAALDSVFTATSDHAVRQEALTRKLIRAHRDEEGVLVLVGHQANVIDLTGIAPESGEGVVVQADGRGGLAVQGRIPAPKVRADVR